MKIGYICPKFYAGEIPLYEYTQGLAALGCEVHAIVTGRPGEAARERVGGVWVERVAPDLSASNEHFRFAFIAFLRAAMAAVGRSADWDVVNVRNLPGAAALPLRYGRHARAWVLEIQSPPLHSGWRAALSNYRVRLESRAFATTLVHAQSVAEEIFGGDNGRFVELPIGVDLAHFKPGRNAALRATLGVAPDDILLIYTGAIKPIRTLDRLILAFAQAQETLGNLHLLFVGEGSDLPRLHGMAAAQPWGERVHFAGLVSYEAMPAYMQAADIGLGYVPVVPWFDKAPVLKTMESLASGLPTVATATQGNRAYIEHGVSGFLVADTPPAIAEAVVTLARDEPLRRTLGRNGRQAMNAYRWSHIVENILLPTYSALLRRPSGTPQAEKTP